MADLPSYSCFYLQRANIMIEGGKGSNWIKPMVFKL